MKLHCAALQACIGVVGHGLKGLSVSRSWAAAGQRFQSLDTLETPATINPEPDRGIFGTIVAMPL